MDEFDNEILNELQETSKVPEIVDEKCREAYQTIRSDQAAPHRNKRYLIAKICLPIAACFAVIIGVSYFNPVLAAQIPVVNHITKPVIDIFKFLNDNPGDGNFTGNQGEYAQDVSSYSDVKDSQDADIQVQKYYCSGTDLYVTYIATFKNPPAEKYAKLYSENNVKYADGHTINNDCILYLYRNDDGSYVGIQQYDLKEIKNLPDTFNFSITINNLKGSMTPGTAIETQYVHTSSGDRIENAGTAISGTWSFNFPVQSDSSHDKVYTVNKTNNSVELIKIVVKPDTTYIYFKMPESIAKNIPMIKVLADNNKRLYPIIGPDDYSWIQVDAVPKDTKNLNISVLDSNDEVLAKFTVPLNQ